MQKITPLLLAASLSFAAPAQAADWVLGLGGTDFSSGPAKDDIIGTAEIHGRPFTTVLTLPISAAGAAEVDGNGDFWIGAGLSTLRPVGDSRWFVEASLMPGFYEENIRPNDLGGNLQFRSLLGVGVELGNGSKLSVAATHKSNAGINERNPGANAVLVRYRREF